VSRDTKHLLCYVGTYMPRIKLGNSVLKVFKWCSEKSQNMIIFLNTKKWSEKKNLKR